MLSTAKEKVTVGDTAEVQLGTVVDLIFESPVDRAVIDAKEAKPDVNWKRFAEYFNNFPGPESKEGGVVVEMPEECEFLLLEDGGINPNERVSFP